MVVFEGASRPTGARRLVRAVVGEMRAADGGLDLVEEVAAHRMPELTYAANGISFAVQVWFPSGVADPGAGARPTLR